MRNFDQIAYLHMKALEPAAAAVEMNSVAFIMFISECQESGVEDPEDLTLGQVAAIMASVTRRYTELFGE